MRFLPCSLVHPKAHWFGFFQYLSIQDISGLNLLCFLKSQFRTLRTTVITAEEIFFLWLPMKPTSLETKKCPRKFFVIHYWEECFFLTNFVIWQNVGQGSFTGIRAPKVELRASNKPRKKSPPTIPPCHKKHHLHKNPFNTQWVPQKYPLGIIGKM